MSLKRTIKRLVPPAALSGYHWLLAKLAAWKFGHPSEKLIVVGVTGTNGKSTTANLIARVLEAAGDKVGLATTINFKVAEKEWLNDTKMTMLGRDRLQALLADMVKAGCKYAVIETSSEGNQAAPAYRHQLRPGGVHQPNARAPRGPRRF
jgi:UDP-N-acetylmuramoyl-L-alanyl-D-glutamate--2,6-diaminopimelate ligase